MSGKVVNTKHVANKDDGALERLQVGRALLERASSPQEVKTVVAGAEAVRGWARKAALGLEAQNEAALLVYEAKRKGDQMLASMVSHGGDRGNQHTGGKIEPLNLARLGITPHESMQWQLIACIPQDDYERILAEWLSENRELTTHELVNYGRSLEREHMRAAKEQAVAAAMAGVAVASRVRVLHGDFRDLLEASSLGSEPAGEASVDLIFTDPPYERASLPLWDALGEHAARLLRPGGFLLAYSGQMFHEQVLRRVRRGGAGELEYDWLISVEHTHANTSIFEKAIWATWQPIVVWRKKGAGNPWSSSEWLLDHVSMGNDHAKVHHEWAQPVEQATLLLKKF
jgi:hypothetical protein